MPGTAVFEHAQKPIEQFPEQFLEHQEPTSSTHMEQVPVSMNIEYEEVYPQQVLHQNDINEAGKVYYENEMEDLVYHEIYGEESEQQKLGHDKSAFLIETTSFLRIPN